jgi:hypothetical protein
MWRFAESQSHGSGFKELVKTLTETSQNREVFGPTMSPTRLESRLCDLPSQGASPETIQRTRLNENLSWIEVGAIWIASPAK